MTWVRLDDNIFGNRKVVEVSGPAKLLHIVGICHCAQGLTDGRISKKAFATIAAQAEAKPKHVDELLAADLWHDEGTFWSVNDYLDYNPSRDKVLADREAKKRAGSAGGQASAQARAARSAPRSVQAERNPRTRPVPTTPVVPPDYEPAAVPDALPRASLAEQARAAKQGLRVVASGE